MRDDVDNLIAKLRGADMALVQTHIIRELFPFARAISMSATAKPALAIESVTAYPTSFPVSDGVTLGIGRAVKRDAVIVKVVAGGITGWGEAHHGRCPGRSRI